MSNTVDEWIDLRTVLCEVPRLQAQLRGVIVDFMELTLAVRFFNTRRRATDPSPPYHGRYEIRCSKAIDYAMRPVSPWIMEGVEYMELYYPVTPDLLAQLGVENVNVTQMPGGDGEVFDPPLDLSLLKVARSFVLAEAFHVRPGKQRKTLD